MLQTNPAAVGEYLRGLQQSIIAALEKADGGACVRDAWQKAADEPLRGHGLTCILEGGELFERAGCGFSQVRGAKLPPSATQNRPELAGAPFEAMGVSLVFHAGTTLQDGELKTSGGRVLCVTVLADSVKLAQQRAYAVAARIQFDGAQYRKDIGHRAVLARGSHA